MIDVQKHKKVIAAVICPSVSHIVSALSDESRLAEAVGLARAIDLDVAYSESIRLREVKAATYFSNGFIERMLPIIAEQKIELMVADISLSPIQQRNLERSLKIKVIDRTALILEIFGERAQTKEGVLQVELAHLTYQRSRLVRSWTHLERQRGGAGFLGGPGETQIELDRRIIDDKIIRIKKDLEKVRKTRSIQRGARNKVPYPIAALVGYTNAGKSTLFNLLTKSNVTAENMLFATLDPTLRKITLPSGKDIILSDTVGFISDLPHELVMAFRATLEEVCQAAIILHVRDVSNPDSTAQKNDVLKVLAHLGLEQIQHQNNYVEVLNKADLLAQEDYRRLKHKTAHNTAKVMISAVTAQGIDDLLRLLDEKLALTEDIYEIEFPPQDGKILAWLYAHGSVVQNNIDENSCVLQIKLSGENYKRFAMKNPDVKIRKIQPRENK